MSAEKILSVGIDIGTSTTQVIFSLLVLDNTAGYFSVPHVSIVDKEVLYKGKIYTTPLKSCALIDGDAVKEIVEKEFKAAGYAPEDTQTGAAIITGESARKENAAIVLDKLSAFAGDFVVSTAGPDLEAVFAGAGSGAKSYSDKHRCLTMNLDIGGGTTNVAVFDNGELVGKCCLDIGGRLVRVDKEGKLDYKSKSVEAMAKQAGIRLELQKPVNMEEIDILTSVMAGLLEEIIGLRAHSELLSQVKTSGSSSLVLEKPIKAVSFSGGVADFVYHAKEPCQVFPYGDIGLQLGESIRKSNIFKAVDLVIPKETIRATVVGAGTYSTTLSGSTITYSSNILPLKNIPVLKLTEKEEEKFGADSQYLTEKAKWFLKQNDDTQLVLAIRGKKNPSYWEVTALGNAIFTALDSALDSTLPLIIIVEQDIAKALGQFLRKLSGRKRGGVVLDSIYVEENDYVDMGKPVMNGMAVPVIVKTLVFD